jgi:beta-lactamase regulating signal transducer with metallopeptidase domain/Mg-chelatase subunit ChlD
MATDMVTQLISASIRICGLALVAFVSLSVLRIRSSAARHAMWTVVLIGMLLQIPLEMVAPPILLKTLPILPAPTQLRVMQSARPSMSAARATAPASHAREPVTFSRTPWRTTVTGIYLVISLLLFLRLAFGCWRLRKIVRGSTSIPSLGPNVFELTRVVVPGSVGGIRARILLPRAWRDWDVAKLGAVLAHERAHIQRYDWLTHLASRLTICIFWFHPLAWWIDRELARLAEEACDDVAVSETNDQEEYAATLVDIARTAAASGGVLSWPVILMATDPNVTRRVNRILKGAFQVPKPFGRSSWAALFVSSVPVIYLSAVVSLAPARRDSMTLKHALISNRRTEELLQPLLQEHKNRTGLLSDVVSNQNTKSPMSAVQSQSEDRPLATCILLDTSGSMYEKRAEVIAAALTLVKATTPHDEFCILSFDDEVFNTLPNDEDFTSSIKEIKEAVSRIDARGGKAMRDAIQTGIDHLGLTTHNERKVLVLITEGYDTSSKVTQQQLLEKVKSSRVPVYGIGLLSESDPQRQDAARLELGELADASGGLALYPKNVAEVESISRQIANEAGKR